ncbi:hypothetical protein B0H14DRAFT_2885165 [Mycena olivaceomarginata]|nr:hypothetical protein B0H14DRAFT_2885165 [Mycena olivaceomarginata]
MMITRSQTSAWRSAWHSGFSTVIPSALIDLVAIYLSLAPSQQAPRWLNEDLVDCIMICCPDVETLKSMRLVCRAFNDVFKAHRKGITKAVAYNLGYEICDNLETIQYTSTSPTFYFGKNNICGRHRETEFGAKRLFKAFDGQLELEIIPGEDSEATSNVLDFVYRFRLEDSEEARALTVKEFMEYLFDAMNESFDEDNLKNRELMGVVELDGVEMRINTERNGVQVVGKWKRATQERSVETACEKCREWLEING